jgi:nucleotide-binding universal stress UspA family protein
MMSESSKLVLITVVDETPVISQSATTMMAYDPTPLFEALDSQGKAVLTEALNRSLKAKVEPVTELVHDTPLSGILDMIDKYDADIVIMGTHARAGLSRMFIGSTTEGVLRSTNVPVFTVRCTDAQERHPFASVLLGIDDSDASDAAVGLAAQLASCYDAKIVACNAIDLTTLYESAAAFPFDAQQVVKEMHAESEAMVAASLKRASFVDGTVPVSIVDGKAATVLLEAAQSNKATAIMMGSHGRRGVQRFFLGSVAEDVVRSSTIPVLVVRAKP